MPVQHRFPVEMGGNDLDQEHLCAHHALVAVTMGREDGPRG